MRRTRLSCVRRRTGLCGASVGWGVLAAGLAPLPAWAGADQISRDQSEARSQEGAAAAPVYEDRLIDGGQLAPETSSDAPPPAADSGHLRSLVVEFGGSITAPRSRVDGISTTGLDQTQREAGISVSGRYQTDNFGLLGLDAQLRRGSSASAFGSSARQDWSGSAALSSRGLPLGNGWLADARLGAATTLSSDLARRQTRFFLPSIPILGGAVTLSGYERISPGQADSEPAPKASVNLALGEPGLFGGLRLSDFTGLGGLAVAGGGQVELSPAWSAGIQAIAVKDTRDPYAVVLQTQPGGEPRISAQGAFAAVAYNAGRLRLQANGVWSHRTGGERGWAGIIAPGDAGGGWLDARLRAGRATHSAGLYYFGPGLAWGTSALINNARGGYYRFATASQRWRWAFNLDAVDSVDGRGSSGLIANADVRRKLNFTTGVGLNGTVRKANGQISAQLLGYVDVSTHLGETRAEAGWAHDPTADLYRLGLHQHWSLPDWLPAGSRLSTQVSYQHARQTSVSAPLGANPLAERTDSVALGLSAGATPLNGVSFDAAFAYNSDARVSAAGVYGPVDASGGVLSMLSTQQGQAFSATFMATARLSTHWSLSASYTDTTSALTARFGLSDPNASLLGILPGQISAGQRSSFRLRAGFLTLRYTGSAGRARGALGLRAYPVGGTGDLEGQIFLDANDNRRREPSEAGVPGILVILDGIQAVRTDEAGFYRFESVADGTHQITLNTDALPLPWIIEADDKRQSGEPYAKIVEIGVRAVTRLDIAAGTD